MNPIAIVLLALQGVVAAIGLAEKLITNTSVNKVLEEVKGAIQTAVSILGGVHLAFAEKVANEDVDPMDPNVGGINAEDHREDAA